MPFLFILVGFSGLIEARRQQDYKFRPGEKEGIATAPAKAKGVMLMNRIGPSSELFVANADGTGEHKLLPTSGFDYHASYSYDGKWIMFTSERSGFGQADIHRVHPDGTGLERLTDSPALDDQGGVVSGRDSSRVCFHSRNTPSQHLDSGPQDEALSQFDRAAGDTGRSHEAGWIFQTGVVTG
jgi:Tol biopolymer transport system component